ELWVTVAEAKFSIAPPRLTAELCEKPQLVIVAAPTSVKIAPANRAELFVNVELAAVRVAVLNTAPPSRLAVLGSKGLPPCKATDPLFQMAPPPRPGFASDE